MELFGNEWFFFYVLYDLVRRDVYGTDSGK